MCEPTVFIHSCQEDPHAESVAGHLRTRGIPVEILRREECFSRWSIACSDSEVTLSKQGSIYREHEIRSIYWRRDYLVEPAWLPANALSPEVARFLSDQRAMHIESAFLRLARSRPFINDLHANRRASSKTLQHELARKSGLRVPATYIGNSPSYAEGFARSLWSQGKRCCTKNLESVHVCVEGRQKARLTQILHPEDLPTLDGLHICPMIFQEYIEKIYEYRVTVVGEEVYTCQIDSQAAGGQTAVDWRHYNIPHTPHRLACLPRKVEAGIVRLVRSLGLVYGALDLVEDSSHDFYFLEINSMGQWLWIEDLTDLPISAAIARHLADPSLLEIHAAENE